MKDITKENEMKLKQPLARKDTVDFTMWPIMKWTKKKQQQNNMKTVVCADCNGDNRKTQKQNNQM